jgi:hypothetical protein
MKRILVFAALLVAVAGVAALVATAAPDSAPASPSADLFPPAATSLTCQVFACDEVVPCPCEYPVIVPGEVCEDKDGRHWKLGRCNPTDRHCQTTIETTCP